MTIRGKDRFLNLSEGVRYGEDGQPLDDALVRYGDYVVPVAVAWVLEPLGGSPGVRAEFEWRRTGPACTAVTISAQAGGRPITATDLENLPLHSKGRQAFRDLGTRVPEDSPAGETVEAAIHRLGGYLSPDRRAVAVALSGHSDADLAEIAAIYRANMDAPHEAVWQAMGGDGPPKTRTVSRRTVDRRIREARDRGFLPQTTPGRKKA